MGALMFRRSPFTQDKETLMMHLQATLIHRPGVGRACSVEGCLKTDSQPHIQFNAPKRQKLAKHGSGTMEIAALLSFSCESQSSRYFSKISKVRKGHEHQFNKCNYRALKQTCSLSSHWGRKWTVELWFRTSMRALPSVVQHILTAHLPHNNFALCREVQRRRNVEFHE